MQSKEKIRRGEKKLIGKILSDKMEKSRVVEVILQKQNPIYKKSFLVSSKIMAHDEKNEFKKGDLVEIGPIRPKSKNKAWKILRKVK